MDYGRRGLAGLGRYAIQMAIRSDTMDLHRRDNISEMAAPYHVALNGVNQPLNMLFKDALWMTLGLVATLIFIFRLLETSWAHIRLVNSLGRTRDQQNFWKITQPEWLPTFKRSIWYAPLGTKRHNREMKLTSFLHMGCVPSRMHTIFIFLFALFSFCYCFVLDWSNPDPFSTLAELRGRSGTLAVVHMVPLVLLAGRNNPLIPLLRISFDTYNLVHRWLGRLAVVESVIHALSWAVVTYADGGSPLVKMYITTHAFQGSGMVAVTSMVILGAMALSPSRHAFYEIFLNAHIILALVIVVCVYIHCLSSEVAGGLPQTPWLIAIFCIWTGDRCARIYRIAYINWSKRGFTQATIEAMPCEATRVTFHLPRYLNVRPGTHCYIRVWNIHFWECHPFSIAWVQHKPVRSKTDLPVSDKPSAAMTQAGVVCDRDNTTTDVSFLIGAQSGWTRRLYNKALAAGDNEPLRLRAAIEGPYGGHHALDSYGHVVLFAGATGITHQLSYIRHLVRGCNSGIVATRKILLVWVIRDYESLEWIRPWMDEILALPNRREILRIELYITRPKNPKDIVSPSDNVRMYPGRPNAALILKKEADQQVGSMCVTICGPGALADDIRDAARHLQTGRSVVDYVEESFTW